MSVVEFREHHLQAVGPSAEPVEGPAIGRLPAAETRVGIVVDAACDLPESFFG